MSKIKKFLLLAWFLIPIDPKLLYAPIEPEKMPSIIGPFEDHIQCRTRGEMLKLSRPDWIMICGYTMYDLKEPKPFAPAPANEGK